MKLALHSNKGTRSLPMTGFQRNLAFFQSPATRYKKNYLERNLKAKQILQILREIKPIFIQKSVAIDLKVLIDLKR